MRWQKVICTNDTAKSAPSKVAHSEHKTPPTQPMSGLPYGNLRRKIREGAIITQKIRRRLRQLVLLMARLTQNILAVWDSVSRGRKLGCSFTRTWVERDLHRGDLRALNDIAFRSIDRPPSLRVERLCNRGLLVQTDRGNYRMTLQGWIAVFLRHTSARGLKQKGLDA